MCRLLSGAKNASNSIDLRHMSNADLLKLEAVKLLKGHWDKQVLKDLPSLFRKLEETKPSNLKRVLGECGKFHII